MSVSGDFGQPPAGLDLSANQNTQLLGGVITITILASLAVILRVYTRIKTTESRFMIDDYLIFAALFFAYGTSICIFISLNYGNGHHIYVLTDHEFTVVWRLLFAHVILYAVCVTCTKSSIMFFYRRLFGLRISFSIMMVLILSYLLVVIVTIFAACRPLSYFWKQYTDPSATGTCINTAEFFLGNGIGAVVIDFMILVVPIPIIWGLQMPRSQRVAVIGILLLGGFVGVAGIVRLIVLNENTHSDDAAWSIAPVFLWSCVEPFIGIVCACLPTFAPLFRRWWAVLITRKTGSSTRKDTEQKSGFLDRSQRSRKTGPTTSFSDEVELTHANSGRTSPSRMRDENEVEAYPETQIMVKDEVTVTWN